MNGFRIRYADPTHTDWRAISVDNEEKTSDCELFSDVNASVLKIVLCKLFDVLAFANH